MRIATAVNRFLDRHAIFVAGHDQCCAIWTPLPSSRRRAQLWAAQSRSLNAIRRERVIDPVTGSIAASWVS